MSSKNQSLKTARKNKTTNKNISSNSNNNNNKNISSNNNKNRSGTSPKNNIQNIKMVNDEQIQKENIYSNLMTNNISLQTFTRAINNIKKLLIENNIMLINTTLTEALIKNYDILTKYILNSNKSQNTKRTLLNNILLILKSNSNLSFSDYVKYDIARKQIKIS